MADTPTPFPALQRLLGPHTVDTFLTEYWEQRALFIPRPEDPGFRPLVTLAEMDEILTARPHRHPDMILVDARRDLSTDAYTNEQLYIDPTRAARLFASGATIVLNHLDESCRAVRDLCAALESELGIQTQANTYFTPSGAQGFDIHYDTHDVITVQCVGRKTWRLYDSPHGLPMRGEQYVRDNTPVGPRSAEFTTGPGDALYIPRGLQHDAVAADEGPSLHITFGFHPVRWSEVVVEALASLAVEDPAMRQSVPLGALVGKVPLEKIAAGLAARVAELVPAIRWELVHDKLAQRFAGLHKEALEGIFHDAASSLGDDTRYTRRPGTLTLLEATDNAVLLTVNGRTSRWPAHAEPALRAALVALETPSFRSDDLGDSLDSAGRETLLRRLLSDGALRILRSTLPRQHRPQDDGQPQGQHHQRRQHRHPAQDPHRRRARAPPDAVAGKHKHGPHRRQHRREPDGKRHQQHEAEAHPAHPHRRQQQHQRARARNDPAAHPHGHNPPPRQPLGHRMAVSVIVFLSRTKLPPTPGQKLQRHRHHQRPGGQLQGTQESLRAQGALHRQREEPHRKHRHGVGHGHREPQGHSVPERAPRAHEVRAYQGLSVPRGERMGRPEEHGQPQSQRHGPRPPRRVAHERRKAGRFTQESTASTGCRSLHSRTRARGCGPGCTPQKHQRGRVDARRTHPHRARIVGVGGIREPLPRPRQIPRNRRAHEAHPGAGHGVDLAPPRAIVAKHVVDRHRDLAPCGHRHGGRRTKGQGHPQRRQATLPRWRFEATKHFREPNPTTVHRDRERGHNLGHEPVEIPIALGRNHPPIVVGVEALDLGVGRQLREIEEVVELKTRDPRRNPHVPIHRRHAQRVRPRRAHPEARDEQHHPDGDTDRSADPCLDGHGRE